MQKKNKLHSYRVRMVKMFPHRCWGMDRFWWMWRRCRSNSIMYQMNWRWRLSPHHLSRHQSPEYISSFLNYCPPYESNDCTLVLSRKWNRDQQKKKLFNFMIIEWKRKVLRDKIENSFCSRARRGRCRCTQLFVYFSTFFWSMSLHNVVNKRYGRFSFFTLFVSFQYCNRKKENMRNAKRRAQHKRIASSVQTELKLYVRKSLHTSSSSKQRRHTRYVGTSYVAAHSDAIDAYNEFQPYVWRCFHVEYTRAHSGACRLSAENGISLMRECVRHFASLSWMN